MIETVAEMYKCDFDKAAKLDIMEFLSIYSYAYNKRKLQEDMMKREYARINRKH